MRYSQAFFGFGLDYTPLDAALDHIAAVGPVGLDSIREHIRTQCTIGDADRDTRRALEALLSAGLIRAEAQGPLYIQALDTHCPARAIYYLSGAAIKLYRDVCDADRNAKTVGRAAQCAFALPPP